MDGVLLPIYLKDCHSVLKVRELEEMWRKYYNRIPGHPSFPSKFDLQEAYEGNSFIVDGVPFIVCSSGNRDIKEIFVEIMTAYSKQQKEKK